MRLRGGAQRAPWRPPPCRPTTCPQSTSTRRQTHPSPGCGQVEGEGARGRDVGGAAAGHTGVVPGAAAAMAGPASGVLDLGVGAQRGRTTRALHLPGAFLPPLVPAVCNRWRTGRVGEGTGAEWAGRRSRARSGFRRPSIAQPRLQGGRIAANRPRHALDRALRGAAARTLEPPPGPPSHQTQPDRGQRAQGASGRVPHLQTALQTGPRPTPWRRSGTVPAAHSAPWSPV